MRWRTVAIIGVAVLLGFMLFAKDPEQGGFLACPFRYLTGWQCPGCGSQRALHDLMHGHIGEAFGHNALLVISIPLLLVQWAVGRFLLNGRSPGNNNLVVFGWLAVVIGWWVGRNVL